MLIEYAGKSYEVDQVIAKLSAVVTPARLAKIKHVINHRDDRLAVVLENIYDRGNSSAVMRSMEAFGFFQLHQTTLLGPLKESARVTQGADKWLLHHEWQEVTSCTEYLKAQGYKIYVTHLAGGKPITDIDFAQPVALCFGNEKDGASSALLAAADEQLFIPMYGFVQSFNISVAAALCFQHVRQQHLSKPQPLAAPMQTFLMARYLLKSCKNPNIYLS